MQDENWKVELSGNITSKNGERLLEFDVRERKGNKVAANIKIDNQNQFALGYKFKCTTRKRYFVRNPIAIVPPFSSHILHVTLLLQNLKQQSLSEVLNDKFLVQIIRYDGSSEPTEINHAIKKQASSASTYKLRAHLVGIETEDQTELLSVDPIMRNTRSQETPLLEASLYQSKFAEDLGKTQPPTIDVFEDSYKRQHLEEQESYKYQKLLEESDKQIYNLREEKIRLEKDLGILRAQIMNSKDQSTKAHITAHKKGFEMYQVLLVALLGMLLGQLI